MSGSRSKSSLILGWKPRLRPGSELRQPRVFLPARQSSGLMRDSCCLCSGLFGDLLSSLSEVTLAGGHTSYLCYLI